MKRLTQILLTTILAIGISTTAFAQSDNDNITADATVNANVSVTAGNNLNFGVITPGSNDVVNIGDTEAGTFTVTSNSGNITLSFNALTELTGQNTSETLPFDFSTGANGGTTNYAGWSDGSTPSDNEFDASTGTTVDFVNNTSDGEITVFVGGVVSPTANQAADTYEGTITLTATHN